MTATYDRLRDLVEKCIEGTATSEEQQEVVAAASSSDVVCAEIVRDLLFDGSVMAAAHDTKEFAQGVMEQVTHHQSRDTFAREVRKGLRWEVTPRKGPRWRLRFPALLAVAAVLVAVVAAIWLMVDGPWSMGQGVVLARVTEVSGHPSLVRPIKPWRTRVMRAKQPAALKRGDEIREGDRINTGSMGQVKLTYMVGATVELGANVECGVRNAELLELQKGHLTAHVEKRSEFRVPSSEFDEPFVVCTPHARVEVIGTLYTVNVQKQYTRVDVEEGQVRVTGLAGGKSVLVSPRKFVVVGSTFAMKPYTQGTKRVDGEILFQDNFEEGLSRWTFEAEFVGTDGSRRPLAGTGSRVVLKKVNRDGHESTVMVLKAEETKSGAIWQGVFPDVSNLPEDTGTVGECDLFIQLPASVSPDDVETIGMGVPGNFFRRWVRMRDEYVPKHDTVGISEFIFTRFCDGKRQGVIPSSRPKYGLRAGRGVSYMIDNMVIRRLVPAPE